MKKTSLYSRINQLPVVNIPADFIYISKERSLLIKTVDEDLMQSIKEKGLFKPLVVKQTGKDDYRVVIGEHRFLACQNIGMQEVSCKVCNFSDEEIARLRMIRDVDWRSFTSMQEAKWYQFIINREVAKNRNELSRILEFSRSRITQKMNLLHLPESIQDFLIKQPEVRITEFQLRPLLQIEDAHLCIQIFNELIEQNLTAQQVKEKVDHYVKHGMILKRSPLSMQKQDALSSPQIKENPDKAYNKMVTLSEPIRTEAFHEVFQIEEHSRPIDDQIADIVLQLEAQPNAVDLLFRLGHLYHRKGLYADAITELERVVHLQPDHQKAYYYLGCAYNKMEHLREAEVALKKAIELEPKLEKAYYYLGIIYDKLRLFDQAKIAYYKVKQIQEKKRQAMYAGNSIGEYVPAIKSLSRLKQDFLNKIAQQKEFTEDILVKLREMLIEIVLTSPGHSIFFESFSFQVQSTDRDHILWVSRSKYDYKHQVEMDLAIDSPVSDSLLAEFVEALEENGLVYFKNEV